jgi:hypothetical protein
MDFKIKKLNFVYELDNHISHIVCYLNIGKKFDIEIYDFYYWLIENNEPLSNYVEKFQNWEEVTNDLKSLSFDFVINCENYINSQFKDDEILEFIYV